MKNRRHFRAGRGLRDEGMQTLRLPVMRESLSPPVRILKQLKAKPGSGPGCPGARPLPDSTLTPGCGRFLKISSVALLVASYLRSGQGTKWTRFLVVI